jgi:ATP-dependent helicase/nuclease subunit A
MKEQLDQALSYEYPYLEDTGLYTQMSVSELKKQSQIGREEENIGTERKDLSEVRLDHEHEMEPESSEAEDGKKQTETGKKGAFRGTAYHRALECLDLLAVTDQRKLEGDLLDLFQRGFLTEEAYESIFPWDIWNRSVWLPWH